MKIAVVGSRKYPHKHHVKELLEKLVGKNVTIVSGRSPGGGVDVWAEQYADSFGMAKEIYPIPADPREQFRERAMKRNWEIARACDCLVAFWDGDSTGTTHALTATLSLRKPILLMMPDAENDEREREATYFEFINDNIY